MQIVTQSATLSYSLFPSRLLLPAPPPRKQICAPHIAGLLPARAAAPHVEVITQKPLSHDEFLRQLGPIRSREEMNAEIADLALEALQFLNGLRSPSGRPLARERAL
jgi:hypothetical protein